jgi:hypothetical protein
MTTTNYIPRPDPEFEAWFARFLEYAVANAAALGLTPADILEIQAGKATWSVAYANYQTAQNAAKASTQTKQEKRDAAEEMLRKFVKMIQARPGTTDAQRAGLGVTVPDRVPTPTDPEAIRRISPPEMELDYSKPQQVTVHAGPYPKDERRNGFPKPAAGFELDMVTGAIPSGTENLDALAWQHVGNYPHSPALVIIGHAATVTFRARYFDQLNNVGPWGPPESCSVTA